MLRVAATYSMERAFRRTPLAANLSATSSPLASNGEMSPAAISASEAWLRQTLWNRTGGPMAWAFQNSTPRSAWDKCFLRLPLDGPDDDLPRSFLGQSESFDCCKKCNPCNWLVPAMQNASSSSQCVNQATVGEDPCNTIAATSEAGVFGLSAPAPVREDVTTHDIQRPKSSTKGSSATGSSRYQSLGGRPGNQKMGQVWAFSLASSTIRSVLSRSKELGTHGQS